MTPSSLFSVSDVVGEPQAIGYFPRCCDRMTRSNWREEGCGLGYSLKGHSPWEWERLGGKSVRLLVTLPLQCRSKEWGILAMHLLSPSYSVWGLSPWVVPSSFKANWLHFSGDTLKIFPRGFLGNSNSSQTRGRRPINPMIWFSPQISKFQDSLWTTPTIFHISQWVFNSSGKWPHKIQLLSISGYPMINKLEKTDHKFLFKN